MNRTKPTMPVQKAIPLIILGATLGMMLLLCACSRQTTRIAVPPPPEQTEGADRGSMAAESTAPGANANSLPKSGKKTRPIYVETGVASWYGPPYHNRQGANGETFNMQAMTAAHRTLPLNSIARVTNLSTGRSAMVRITDRGPFIEGRMLDLSLAAAKQVDVWRAGLARVKLEVLYAPARIDTGGRWCVQIGAFTDKQAAAEFKKRLQRRYRTADVLQFTGPTGDWIRIRVPDDDKERAERLLRENAAPEGAAFLVRLD